MYKPIAVVGFVWFCNNCLMVWAITNPNVYPGAASLLFFPRKENRRVFFNSARKFRLKTGSISYECARRNTVSSDSGGKSCFVPVFNDRWQVHSKSKSLLYVSEQYSRVVKIYYKKNKLCGQIMSENYQVTCSTQFLLLKLLKAIVANHNRAAKFLRWQQPNR